MAASISDLFRLHEGGAPVQGAPGPAHVGIVMDGNGRWARQRHLPRVEGHRRGAQAARAIIQAAIEEGISCVTLYAFSTENWQRPREEVGFLLGLMENFLERHVEELVKEGIRLNIIGRWEAFPEKLCRRIEDVLARTAGNSRLLLTLALNYGSRTEIVDACRRWHEAIQAGQERSESLSWEILSRYLDTAGLPDPDLIIRTSGESRISNFLLLQAAYAEIAFTPVYWPDYTPEHFREALAWFRGRQRRFGRTPEQVAATALS